MGDDSPGKEMAVRTIDARPFAEADVVRCARGDYTWGSVHEDNRSLSELLGHIETDDHIVGAYGDLTPYSTEMEQRMAQFLHERMHHREWGIWEHPSITIEIEGLSRSAMAQLTRHRHLTFDVMSNRYVNVEDIEQSELFIYPPSFTADEVVTRDGVREIDATTKARLRIACNVFATCMSAYEQFVQWGIPEEDARYFLPQGQATNLRVSGNARALMHLLNVRLNANVQWEAKQGMEAVMAECKEWMPLSFSIFEDLRPIPLAP